MGESLTIIGKLLGHTQVQTTACGGYGGRGGAPILSQCEPAIGLASNGAGRTSGVTGGGCGVCAAGCPGRGVKCPGGERRSRGGGPEEGYGPSGRRDAGLTAGGDPFCAECVGMIYPSNCVWIMVATKPVDFPTCCHNRWIAPPIGPVARSSRRATCTARWHPRSRASIITSAFTNLRMLLKYI